MLDQNDGSGFFLQYSLFIPFDILDPILFIADLNGTLFVFAVSKDDNTDKVSLVVGVGVGDGVVVDVDVDVDVGCFSTDMVQSSFQYVVNIEKKIEPYQH